MYEELNSLILKTQELRDSLIKTYEFKVKPNEQFKFKEYKPLSFDVTVIKRRKYHSVHLKTLFSESEMRDRTSDDVILESLVQIF